MNIVLCALCGALMILGAAEFIRLLLFRWTAPLTAKKFTLVVEPEDPEECECVLRAAAERLRWLDLKGPCELVCLDPEENEEIRKICGALSLRYPFLRVCKTGELVYNSEERSS